MYVPVYNNGNCAYLYSDNFIRVYETRPTHNSDVNYIDYLLSHHYLQRSGVQSFSNYSTIPVCATNVNTNFYNRVDFPEILFIFTIFILFNYLFISKLYKALFRGRALK